MEGHRGDTQHLPWASTCKRVSAHTQKKREKDTVRVQQTLKKRRPKQGDATVYPTHGKTSVILSVGYKGTPSMAAQGITWYPTRETE